MKHAIMKGASYLKHAIMKDAARALARNRTARAAAAAAASANYSSHRTERSCHDAIDAQADQSIFPK